MSVKKILSIIMALAMVLTMASFPAFAEDAVQLTPAGITSAFTAASGYALAGVVDGSEDANANYFRASVKITSSGSRGDVPNTSNLHFVADFVVPVNVSNVYTAFGGSFATGVALWGSNDQETWTLMTDLTLTQQRSESAVSHEGYYRYVMVEAYSTKDNNPAILEVTFYGTDDGSVEKITGLDADNVTVDGTQRDWSDSSRLFDGDTAKGQGNGIQYQWTESTTVKTITVTLDEVANLYAMKLYWGNAHQWNALPVQTYAVYCAGEDGVYGDAVYSYTDSATSQNQKQRDDFVEFDTIVENVKSIKIEITAHYATGDPSIREIEIYKSNKEIVKTTATYTVNYVDSEGNPVADAKIVTDKFVDDKVTEYPVDVDGYRPLSESETITLVDGTNEITFVYVPENLLVNYTVNYVDTEGVAVADSKNGEGHPGDVVTEDAVTVDGYTVDKESDSITLDLDETKNVITFTYTAIDPNAPVDIVPIGVTSNLTQYQDSTPLKGIINGVAYASANNYFRSKDLAIGDGITALGSVVFDLAAPTNLTEIWFNMGGCHMKYGKLYGSNTTNDPSATEGWTELHSFENLTFTAVSSDGSAGNTNTQTISHTGEYRYFKVEITKLSKAGGIVWLESTFKGVVKTVTLSADNLTAGNRWGWTTGAVTNGTADVLFDGNPASNTEGYLSHRYNEQPEAVKDDIVIDLGGVIDNPLVAIQGGAPDWNYSHLIAYDIYVAGVGGVYGKTPVASVDYSEGKTLTTETLGNAVKVRTDLINIEAEAVRFIKIVPTYIIRRPILGEISVYGTLTDVSEKLEDTIGAKGGQIRLPEGSISAGIRFGATVLKETVGIEGDYKYDPNATTTFGMFVIPQDILGGATFADYLVANNYAGQALKVPAERIYSEDNYSVTYTAVLVGIPNTEYDRDIVAIPYVCINGTYIFSSEIVRNYAEVAASVATAYEAGEISLSETQITLIEDIIGRTLVAPVVPEDPEDVE